MTKCKLFYIDRKNAGAWLSVLFMLTAAFLRVIYFWGRAVTPLVFWVHFVNVVAAALIFSLTVIFLGEKLPSLTSLSVLMGVVFFTVKSLSFESAVHTVLCMVLYLAVLLIYSLTLFGVIRTKYLLYPLFSLPLLYHIFVEDMQIYILAEPRPPYTDWLPEISVLCIMAALLSVSFAIKKR